MLDQPWEASERFKKFSLRESPDRYVLPERHDLVADRLTGQLWLVNWQLEQLIDCCDELLDEQFSLVLLLLERWPSFVPYEHLLRQIGIEPTGQDLADLERIRASRRAGESEEEQVLTQQARTRIEPLLQTLRDLLASSRACLNILGIEIAAVLDTGMLITRYRAAPLVKKVK